MFITLRGDGHCRVFCCMYRLGLGPLNRCTLTSYFGFGPFYGSTPGYCLLLSVFSSELLCSLYCFIWQLVEVMQIASVFFGH